MSRIPEHRMTVEQRKLVTRLLDETRQTIQEDCKKAPRRLKRFLLYLKREIFSAKLAIGTARSESALGSDYSSQFYKLTGMRPRDYVEYHRLVTAQSIIRHTPMVLWQVSHKVGFDNYTVFGRRYGEILGHAPKKEERAKQSELPRLINSVARRGDSHALDPRLSPNTAEISTDVPSADLRKFWDEIQDMNRAEIKRYLEHMDGIDVDHFHFLLEKAKFERRQHRARGEELGLAAIDALKLVEFRKDQEFPDEKAIAYAVLAHTCSLRFDAKGARKWFRVAERLVPGNSQQKPLLSARVQLLKASALWQQRDIEAAITILDDILPEIRRFGPPELLARGLLLRGELYNCVGHPERAIPVACEAVELLRFVDDPYVVFTAHYNLARFYIDVSMVQEATAQLGEVRRLQETVQGQVLPSYVLYLEGSISRMNQDFKTAELLFLEAREGFIERDLDVYSALVDLDLSLLYLELERYSAALLAAKSAILPISRLGGHPEAIAALAILHEAEALQRVDESVLRRALLHLESFRKDPKAQIAAPASS